MTRTHIASLLVLIVAVPAAIAGSFFASSAKTSYFKTSSFTTSYFKTSNVKPCFIAGAAAYQISGSASANTTVRIDNTAANPSLRMQLVDDPAAADFVLVDDNDSGDACKNATAINSIRVDPAALAADLTVALSQAPADYKIYVRSANFSEQDAAALFAVIWKDSAKTGSGRKIAERN
jgi:hypothetical protein